VFAPLGGGFDYFLARLTGAALVLIGARRLWRFHPLMRGVLAYLAASLLTYGLVYYGDYSFRLLMEPLMIIVAAPLVVSVWRGRQGLREAA
jgi:hypothetical protein